jgi:hypothetical protein
MWELLQHHLAVLRDVAHARVSAAVYQTPEPSPLDLALANETLEKLGHATRLNRIA